MSAAVPVYIIKSSDPVWADEAVNRILTEIAALGGGDPTVDELTGEDYELAAVAMAAGTPSFFGRRVVVARDAGRFGAGDVAELVSYLADPVPENTVVLVWGTTTGRSKPVPKALAEAVKGAGGEVLGADPPSGKARAGWVQERLAELPVKLAPAAVRLILDTLGDDLSRLVGLERTLTGAFAPGATVTHDDVRPLLGESGANPPWELTDAIDGGNVPKALDQLSRLIGAGGRHPLQVMASLTSHVLRIARLDGAGARNEQEAAAILELKGSTFPAKKALNQCRKLGSDRVRAALKLLADADADLRGRTGLPPEAVLERLVINLTRLSASRPNR